MIKQMSLLQQLTQKASCASPYMSYPTCGRFMRGDDVPTLLTALEKVSETYLGSCSYYKTKFADPFAKYGSIISQFTLGK